MNLTLQPAIFYNQNFKNVFLRPERSEVLPYFIEAFQVEVAWPYFFNSWPFFGQKQPLIKANFGGLWEQEFLTK